MLTDSTSSSWRFWPECHSQPAAWAVTALCSPALSPAVLPVCNVTVTMLKSALDLPFCVVPAGNTLLWLIKEAELHTEDMLLLYAWL